MTFKLLSGNNNFVPERYNIAQMTNLINEVKDYCDGFLTDETVPDHIYAIEYGLFKITDYNFRPAEEPNNLNNTTPMMEFIVSVIFQPNIGQNFMMRFVKKWDREAFRFIGDMKLMDYPNGLSLTQQDLNDY